VLPEIAVAKVREDAPFDKICYIGCGVTTGVGAVVNTAKVEPGANVVVFGLGGIGLNVIQGAKMVGADKIIGVDLNPGQGRMAEVRHDALRQPERIGGDIVVGISSQLTDGGADYSFECIGNTKVMRQALECCHAAGASRHHRRGGGGRGNRTRPFQLVTGPSGRARRSAARAAAPTCRRSSTGTWNGKINIDDLITHTSAARAHQRRAST
jgi:S-(hydroxymethyl)glutathione dehydrogenase/alcohol dehydrogenase